MGTELRVDLGGNARQDADGLFRVTTAAVDAIDEVAEIRVDAADNVRNDLDGFVRIVTTASTSTVVDPILSELEGNLNNPRRIFDTPPTAVLDAFTSGFGRVVRYVDIYESDNVTPYRLNVGVTDGNVTVDASRDERRVLEIQLAGEGGNLNYGPDGFWYDKIIKPYRGVTIDGIDLVTCLGEFMIDSIKRPHFPDVLSVSGRDFTKKLLIAKLAETTSFAASTKPEAIIRALLLNSGIAADKINVADLGTWLPNESTFDRLTPIWTVIKTIANSYGYEVFFDNFGVFRMREFVDPLTAPLGHTFKAGTDGSLVSFELNTDDSRLFNEVVVYGAGTDNKLVTGIAKNTAVASPTRIARIGRRTMDFPSQFVTDNTEATAIANRLLAVAALEQYDVSMTSIVAPWLEAGEAVEFLSPVGAVGDPTRFLLTNFTIPLGLSAMSSQVKRVHIVGG